MGLKTDIENAFVKTLGIDVDDKGNMYAPKDQI